MKLQEGNAALDFTEQDIHGNDVRLSDFKGQKIILSFYGNESCPFCNRRIHEIIGNSVKLKRSGVKLVFVFRSKAEKLKASVLHEGISPWPLIGDAQQKLYKLYGAIAQPTKELYLPTDFLIDESFKIAKIHYGTDLTDHIDMADFKAFAGIE